MHPVDAFNAVHTMASLTENGALSMILESGAYYRAAANLGIESPNFSDINQLMAHAISSVTTATRFGTSSFNKLAMLMSDYYY